MKQQVAFLPAVLCQHDSVSTVQHAVTQLYRPVVEMKEEFENGCGPSKEAGSRGLEIEKGPL